MKSTISVVVLVLFGALLATPAQAQLRGPVRNLTNDTSPASGDMLLVDKASPLVSRKLTLHTLATYLMTDPGLVPSTRTITCTPPLLCDGSTSMDLSADRALSLSPFYLPLTGSSWTPASGTAPFTFYSVGSTTNQSPTNQGLRTATWSGFDTRASSSDGVLMQLSCEQSSHTGTIVRTCLGIDTYTEPDNGGDTSGILIRCPGGGPCLTAYKASGLRRPGLADQSLSPQPAIEVGTSDAGPAIIASAGVSVWGTSKTNEAIEARLGSSTSIGILAWPTNNVFDSRVAFAVGSPQSNAQPVNMTFKVLANGNISTPGTVVATGAVTGSNLSGTNTGDQTITLTGDVTGTGTGSFATTLSTSYKGWTDGGTSISTTTSTDKVGIGTSSPTSLLTVSANSAAPQSPTLPGTTEHLISADSVNNRLLIDAHGTSTSAIDFRNSGGTASAPTAVAADANIGQVTWSARGTTAYSSGARASVRGSAAEAWTDTAQGTYVTISTAIIGSTTTAEKLRITDYGHLISTSASAPTVSCTGTGTSPSAPTLVGTDTAFTVTMSTGTGSPGSTGTCTVTFAATGSSAYGSSPPMVCMLVKGATVWGNGATIQETTESATAPVLTWTNLVGGAATALTVSTSYKFSCLVVGR